MSWAQPSHQINLDHMIVKRVLEIVQSLKSQIKVIQLSGDMFRRIVSIDGVRECIDEKSHRALCAIKLGVDLM